MKKEQLNDQVKNMSLVLEVKSLDSKNRIIRGVVGTTGNLDRHGDTVNPDGWILENFLKNPVIFVNHNSWNLPIGKAINVEKVENGLIFDIQFSKTLPKATEVWGLVEEGIMKAWSVGFIVLDWGRPGDEYTIMKQELLELSIVGLPANPDAMSPEKSKSFKALQEFIESHGEKRENHLEAEDVELPEDVEEETEEEKKKNEDDNLYNKLLERIESLETEVKELREAQEKNLQDISKFMNKVESDEEVAEDHIFLALNAVQQELQKDDKDIGKTLGQLNKVLKNIEKE